MYMKRFIAIGVLMLIIALCTTVIAWFVFQDAVSTQVTEVVPVPVDGAGIPVSDAPSAETTE